MPLFWPKVNLSRPFSARLSVRPVGRAAVARHLLVACDQVKQATRRFCCLSASHPRSPVLGVRGSEVETPISWGSGTLRHSGGEGAAQSSRRRTGRRAAEGRPLLPRLS